MNTARTGLTLSEAPHELERPRGIGTPLLDRLGTQQPKPEPDKRPEWVRRADEGKLPAKDLTDR